MGKMSTYIDNIYLSLAKELFAKGSRVGDTRELTNVKVVLKNINNNIVSIRKISPAYLFGELLWYFNADNSLDFISKFSSFWNHLSDDEKTCNSAYGYLMQKRHGFNQVDKVIKILTEDPNSRRAKININFPNASVDTTKDEPCTMSLHYLIRKGKLECTAVMRSNDIWFGFPYDVAFFTELQKYIADKLGVEYGHYTHFAVSLHMYDRDAPAIEKMIKNPVSKPILFNRDKFHEKLKELFSIAKDHGKASLMDTLEQYDIYKGDKE